MTNVVVAAIAGVICWLVQKISEKLLNDKLDKVTNERSRVNLDDDVKNLKSQLRTANCVLVTAQGAQITNEYLLLSLMDLEQLAGSAKKMLDDLGICYCIRSNKMGRKTSRGEEINQNKTENSSHFSERSIIPHSPTDKIALSCEVCSGDDGDTENKAKRKKLDRDDSSRKTREITNQLREMGNNVQGALQLEMMANLYKETQSMSTTFETAIREDGKLKFVRETREVLVSNKKENGPIFTKDDVHESIPTSNIKNLRVVGFDGSILSAPLNHNISNLTNLLTLHLKDFVNLEVLPPLGQLPCLKSLSIENFPAIKEVGKEFYGDGAIAGFPSLQELSLHHLPKCETWAGRDDGPVFPNLKKLTLTNCAKLKGLPCDYGNQNVNNVCLPCLTKLFIFNCPELTLPAQLRAHVLSEESSSQQNVISEESTSKDQTSMAE